MSNSKPTPQTVEPFIGPRAFTRDKEDQSRFFGRDTENDEIISLITSHRLVLIYAQSGAGKTSILNANVIPRLEDYGFEVLPMARVQVTSTENTQKSNNDSFGIENLYMYNALQSLLPKTDRQKLVNFSLFEFLDYYFPNRKDNNGKHRPQILIFDQMEDLFNFYPDRWIEQQKDFFEQVANSLENNALLRVLFIIREEYLAQLDPFKNIIPEKLRPRFRLERLRQREATSAIKGPLRNIISNLDEDERRNIESEIENIVKDLLKIYVEGPAGFGLRQLEGEFIEPIQLQVVCRRWWKERSNGTRIKNSNSQDLVNVDVALEDFYEDAILSASKQSGIVEREIRNWCEAKLITSSGTRSIVHRGYNFTDGMDNNVVDKLEGKYLIRKERRSGASWYELTHDRLIKPIKNSNTRWGRKKKDLILKVAMPRLEDAIKWCNIKARQNKFRFRLYQITTLVAGTVILTVNVLDYANLPLRLTSSIIGAIIASVTGISKLRKHHENWMLYRSMTEFLNTEKYLFENNAGEYSDLEEDEKNQLLFGRLESFVSSETSKYLFTSTLKELRISGRDQ